MIRVYNTMNKKIEELVPLKENEISMYVCGPTVYNYIHIGNARPAIFFDTVRRYFEYRGYKVTYVQNFTDVDDKMIARANQEGVSLKEIAHKYINAYFEDTKKQAGEIINKEKTATVVLLNKLVENNFLRKIGNGPSTRYEKI